MRKMRAFQSLALALALLLLRSTSLGQGSPNAVNTNRILVQVLDQPGNPLRGVSKIRLEMEDGTLVEESNTDFEGRFQFNHVPRANLVIVVRREGYVSVRERLAWRQSLPEIFLSLVLAKAAVVGGVDKRMSRVGTDYLAAPPEARREFDKGIARAQKGDYSGAVAHLKRASQLDAQFLTAWNDLGSNYLRLQKNDLAESAFRKALEINKDFAPALFNLGLLCNSQKRFSEAEAVLVRFTELEATEWQGFFEAGNAHFGLAQFLKAERDFKRVLELNPQAPPVIHVKLGNVYVATRQFSKALEEFKTYLRKDPNGPLAGKVRDVTLRMKADGLVPSVP